MLKSVRDFVSYWYFRYLLVTELFMVEKWERAMFHIIVFLLLSVLYLFNTTVILGLVRMVSNSVFTQEIAKGSEYVITSNNYYNEL